MTITFFHDIPEALVDKAIAWKLFGPERIGGLVLKHEIIEPDGRKRKSAIRSLRIEGLISDDDEPGGQPRVAVNVEAVWALASRLAGEAAQLRKALVASGEPADPVGAVPMLTASFLKNNEGWVMRATSEGRKHASVPFFELPQAQRVNMINEASLYHWYWVPTYQGDYDAATRPAIPWTPGSPEPVGTSHCGYAGRDFPLTLHVADDALLAHVGATVRAMRVEALATKNHAWGLHVLLGIDKADARAMGSSIDHPFGLGEDYAMFTGDPSTWTDQANKLQQHLQEKLRRAQEQLAAVERVHQRVEAYGGWEKFGREYIRKIEDHVDSKKENLP